MSNFRSKAFNPASKRVEDAEYCDDYYGRHRYGVRFDDGCVHPEEQCGIDAAATAIDALQARVKELEAKSASLRETLRLNRFWDFPADTQNLSLKLEAAESRALRAEQERDEAYERAAKVAENPGFIEAQDTDWDLGVNFAKGFIAAAIRQLASGPEKEKKE